MFDGCLQVCWVPIFKAQKLILAGDPMQLPPTIISTDKRKEKGASASSSSTPAQSGPKANKGVAITKDKSDASGIDAGSSDEDQSDTSGDEDDSGLTADPDAPLKTPVKDPRRAGSKPVLRPPRSLETTLFERLEKMYGPGIKRMLTVQYRYAP